jgi:hypothetical protein
MLRDLAIVVLVTGFALLPSAITAWLDRGAREDDTAPA